VEPEGAEGFIRNGPVEDIGTLLCLITGTDSYTTVGAYGEAPETQHLRILGYFHNRKKYSDLTRNWGSAE
jgi:hypothetical protein